jgi:ABC-type glutathione transport system ATPase component
VIAGEPATGEGDVGVEDESAHPIASETTARQIKWRKHFIASRRQCNSSAISIARQKRTCPARPSPAGDIPVEFQLPVSSSQRLEQYLLAMRGVSKRFGGTRALNDARIEVGAGEIVALLGENGAGKSTLIKILAGVHSLDSGIVSYRGRDVTHRLRNLPIAFLHQDLGLIEWMTVAENISLMLGFPRRFGMID